MSSRAAHIGGLIVLLAAIAFGSWHRVHTALTDPNFDAQHPAGMLKSDPGLLYYFVGRILDAGGRVPADFRADPRVEYPLLTDIPALFPVGQEFVVAWTYRLFGHGMPLHVFCVWIMGVWASLCAIGVYGLALELSRRVSLAALAVALYAVMPANYRTIGFILVGEDFSLPWLALHFFLLARAVRVRTTTSIFLASAPLAIALSTWHAMGFFVALEAACVFAWFVRTGANPFRLPRAWILPSTLIAFSIVVPVLRHTLFALSLPMQMIAGLCAAAWWRRMRGGSHVAAVAVACVAWVIVACASIVLSRVLGGGIGEYSHVFGLLREKIVHLGHLPEDPRELPFEVRLMWQGPFNTLAVGYGLKRFGLALLFAGPAAMWLVRGWRRRAEDANAWAVCSLVVLSLPIAYLIERTIMLPGLLLPCVGALALSRVRSVSIAACAFGALCAAQLAFFHSIYDHDRLLAWYMPPQRQTEIAELVAHIPECVPEGEAIACDFMNSTAILAHTGHPIVLQPKYEMRRSRERAEDFLMTFFHGTPDALRRMLIDKYRCRYVVFDRFTLGFLSKYTAGIPTSQLQPDPSSAAKLFLSQDAQVLASVSGYKLLYRSPASIRQSDGSSTDFFRLYELGP